TRGRPRLDLLKLTEDEWALVKALLPLLQCFRYATQRMSVSKIPLIHQVIPFMDSLTIALDSYHDNKESNIAVRIAAARARKIIDKYYAKTDDTSFYRIAMCTY
ncbi:hypothetical protein M422DRAFT_163751, partial [Sphaerobolus stellatus SS14]